MPVPVGAHGTSATTPGAKNKPKSASQSAINQGKSAAQSYDNNRGANQAYLAQLRSMLEGSMMGPGPGGPGGGGYGSGGGGGGYNSGPSAYELWQIQQEKERLARLEAQKTALTGQLQGARASALPQLDRYNADYQNAIRQNFIQNRHLNHQYDSELRSSRDQMNRSTRGTRDYLARDLGGQGVAANDPEMRAMMQGAQVDMAGAGFLSQLGQQYNDRLQQAMNGARTDALNMGAAVNASSRGNLENNYASLLAQIGLIGLT